MDAEWWQTESQRGGRGRQTRWEFWVPHVSPAYWASPLYLRPSRSPYKRPSPRHTYPTSLHTEARWPHTLRTLVREGNIHGTLEIHVTPQTQPNPQGILLSSLKRVNIPTGAPWRQVRHKRRVDQLQQNFLRWWLDSSLLLRWAGLPIRPLRFPKVWSYCLSMRQSVRISGKPSTVALLLVGQVT